MKCNQKITLIIVSLLFIFSGCKKEDKEEELQDEADTRIECSVNLLDTPVTDSVIAVDQDYGDGFENGSNIGGIGLWWFDLNTQNSVDGKTSIAQRKNDLKTVEGDYYLELAGISPKVGTYIGGATYGSDIYGPDPNRKKSFYNLPSDPSKVWFNLYVYGDQNVNTELHIMFHESDFIKSNGSPTNDISKQGIDDGVIIKQCFNHDGWQLFSYSYDQMNFSEFCIPADSTNKNGQGFGCGNKILEPHRIKMVNFSLLSEQNELPVYARIDYPVFTIGGPLDPNFVNR